MDLKELGSVAGNGVGYVLAAIQQNEILQIIEFVLSALLTIIILIYRVWHWVKEARKDGKITDDEIEELGQIIEETKNGESNKK